jgi:hypothetical protein
MDLVLLRGHVILEQCLNGLLARWIEPDRLLKVNVLEEARPLRGLVFASRPGGRDPSPSRIESHSQQAGASHRGTDKPGYHADLEKWACAAVGYTPKTINRRVTHRRIVLKAFYLLSGCLSGAASMAATITKENVKRGIDAGGGSIKLWRNPLVDQRPDGPRDRTRASVADAASVSRRRLPSVRALSDDRGQ